MIGATGRFPKAPDLAAFWDNIRTGRDCISEVPPERWSLERFYDSRPETPGKTPWRQVLDTENLDNPFCETQISEKVIVGGRSIRVYSDEPEEKGATRQRPTKTL